MYQAARTAVPQAYSYLRFSTPEQALGTSEERQIEMARAWAKRQSLPFNETLKPDRGISGFRGKHREKGSLGAFLRMVEAGDIARGSVLVVENIDRLSREGVVATLRHIIFKLWDNGITIQTISPEDTYEPGCDTSPKFIALFLYIQRAQDESKRKSERITDARNRGRKAAQEHGKLLTRQVPKWIEVTKEGERVLVPAAAETVRMIFELANQGMSLRRIERQLNEVAPWRPDRLRHGPQRGGDGWRTSYIRKILSNPAAIGIYQPHQRTDNGRAPVGDPIPGYYPAAVPEDVFYAVQQRLAGNRSTGGRTGMAGNVLTHIVKCAYCGGPMRYVDKGKPPKGAKYLMCDHGVRGVRGADGNPVCRRHAVRYDELVDMLLDNCRRLRPTDVLPQADEQAKQARGMKTRLLGIAARLAEIAKQLGNLDERVADAPSKESAARLFKLIKTKETEKADLVEQRTAAEAALHKLETSTSSFQKWRDDLDALRDAIANGGPETRLRLRAHLREFITRVEVFAAGTTEPAEPPTSWMGVEPIVARTKAFVKKLRELEAWDQYKQGRFYRVHFASDSVVDLIPGQNPQGRS